MNDKLKEKTFKYRLMDFLSVKRGQVLFKTFLENEKKETSLQKYNYICMASKAIRIGYMNLDKTSISELLEEQKDIILPDKTLKNVKIFLKSHSKLVKKELRSLENQYYYTDFLPYFYKNITDLINQPIVNDIEQKCKHEEDIVYNFEQESKPEFDYFFNMIKNNEEQLEHEIDNNILIPILTEQDKICKLIQNNEQKFENEFDFFDIKEEQEQEQEEVVEDEFFFIDKFIEYFTQNKYKELKEVKFALLPKEKEVMKIVGEIKENHKFIFNKETTSSNIGKAFIYCLLTCPLILEKDSKNIFKTDFKPNDFLVDFQAKNNKRGSYLLNILKFMVKCSKINKNETITSLSSIFSFALFQSVSWPEGFSESEFKIKRRKYSKVVEKLCLAVDEAELQLLKPKKSLFKMLSMKKMNFFNKKRPSSLTNDSLSSFYKRQPLPVDNNALVQAVLVNE